MLKLVEGWTTPIDYTVTTDGTPVNLAGMTVALILQKADGSLVDTSSDVTIQDAAGGVIRYSPDAADLKAIDSPLVARWKVTDGGSLIAYWPSEQGEVWIVQPIGAITLQANALISLADLKRGLGISNTDQDVALAAIINGASDFLENRTGRRLKSATYTTLYRYVEADAVYQGRGLPEAWFAPEWPVTALTSLTLDDGVAATPWLPGDSGDPDDADVFVLETTDPKQTRDRLFRPKGWPIGALAKFSSLVAGYGSATVGMPPVPEDLKQGIVVLARDWYYLQSRQVQNLASRSIEGESVSYLNDAMPRIFAPLISAYRRWGS